MVYCVPRPLCVSAPCAKPHALVMVHCVVCNTNARLAIEQRIHTHLGFVIECGQVFERLSDAQLQQLCSSLTVSFTSVNSFPSTPDNGSNAWADSSAGPGTNEKRQRFIAALTAHIDRKVHKAPTAWKVRGVCCHNSASLQRPALVCRERTGHGYVTMLPLCLCVCVCVCDSNIHR